MSNAMSTDVESDDSIKKPPLGFFEEYKTYVKEPMVDSTAMVKRTWFLAALSGILTLVIITLGVLHASDDGSSNSPCVSFEASQDTTQPAAQVPLCAAESLTSGGIYMDFISQCKQENKVDWQCPTPFPTYASSAETTPSCDLVVVGAGTGGLYTALRLVDTGKLAGSQICVFELAERVGGRIYSLRGLGPERDLSVDAGAYRTWRRFTPVTYELITTYLGLTVKCYEENEDPCQRHVIVDEKGHNAGFTSFVEEMMKRLEAKGVRWFPNSEAVSIQKAALTGDAKVVFSNGVVATATGSIILNIPQRPLMELIRNSSLPEGLMSKRNYQGIHGIQTEIVTKLYLYYPVAWWLELGLTDGDFEAPGDAQNMLLKGRYHDGEVHCTDKADPSTCHGFLLGVYAHDFAGENAMFFRRFQSDRPTPVTIISNATVEGAMFLEAAHKSMSDFHKNAGIIGKNYTYMDAVKKVEETTAPWFAVLATWNIATRGAGGGWHGWTDLKYKKEAEEPMTAAGIHVINEANSNVQGWAEGSLQRADSVLKEFFDVSHPWPFEVPDTRQIVQQTAAAACAPESGGGTAGGTAGGGGGGGDEEDMSHLCFLGDARVSLANGSSIALKDTSVGDRVWTASGAGWVTEVLVHPVNKRVPVIVVRTELGELVGSPEHPVYADGEWMELQDAHKRHFFAGNSSIETRYVDTFYNLEVDGDAPGETSSHSYVVNGVEASGNGDNYLLNTLFPRQNVWKCATTFSGIRDSAVTMGVAASFTLMAK